MKIDSYSVSSDPFAGVCKQSAVWGQTGSSIYPLIYLQRPKYIKCDKKCAEIVGSVRMNLPKGFEV